MKETKIDEVITELRHRIEAVKYVAGQRLPAERELAEELGTSRVTIRAALLRLQADNVVDVVPRGGTFVRSLNRTAVIGNSEPLLATSPELKRHGSFIRAMEAQGRKVFVRFIEPSALIIPGEKITAKMNINPDIQLLRRYRVHFVDRVPYRILDSYYLASLLGELVGQDEGYTPLFQWLREHKNRKATHASEQLRCRMPSAEEAALLNVSRGQPIIDLDRWVWDDTNVLFEYTHMVANGALHEFTYRYDIDEEASQ